ncbi:MAG: hypothetical protein WBA77_14395 [Microcoleaceae cyanobacterium]
MISTSASIGLKADSLCLISFDGNIQLNQSSATYSLQSAHHNTSLNQNIITDLKSNAATG